MQVIARWSTLGNICLIRAMTPTLSGLSPERATDTSTPLEAKVWSQMRQFSLGEGKKIGCRDGYGVRPSGRDGGSRVRRGAGTADHRSAILHNRMSVRRGNAFQSCGPEFRLLADLVERDCLRVGCRRSEPESSLARHVPSCLSANEVHFKKSAPASARFGQPRAAFTTNPKVRQTLDGQRSRTERRALRSNGRYLFQKYNFSANCISR